jgi:hypothetical protein
MVRLLVECTDRVVERPEVVALELSISRSTTGPRKVPDPHDGQEAQRPQITIGRVTGQVEQHAKDPVAL